VEASGTIRLSNTFSTISPFIEFSPYISHNCPTRSRPPSKAHLDRPQTARLSRVFRSNSRRISSYGFAGDSIRETQGSRSQEGKKRWKPMRAVQDHQSGVRGRENPGSFESIGRGSNCVMISMGDGEEGLWRLSKFWLFVKRMNYLRWHYVSEVFPQVRPYGKVFLSFPIAALCATSADGDSTCSTGVS
jgi:hypothetical protein